ncbi:hypothetical protein, partial [Atlantibacter hermannii]|uniref:hypothetical protein n=1 Tax=Atlantibacter hermannii TaxID=565 RepID=UPI0028ABE30B
SPVTIDAHRCPKRTEQFHKHEKAPPVRRTEQFHTTQKSPASQANESIPQNPRIPAAQGEHHPYASAAGAKIITF